MSRSGSSKREQSRTDAVRTCGDESGTPFGDRWMRDTKLIPDSELSGQHDINLIEGVVLDMALPLAPVGAIRRWHRRPHRASRPTHLAAAQSSQHGMLELFGDSLAGPCPSFLRVRQRVRQLHGSPARALAAWRTRWSPFDAGARRWSGNPGELGPECWQRDCACVAGGIVGVVGELVGVPRGGIGSVLEEACDDLALGLGKLLGEQIEFVCERG